MEKKILGVQRGARWPVAVSLLLATTALYGSPARAQSVAQADSGTADAGMTSRPIANVAANDTVNGVLATLGAGGNAIVAKVGRWQAGVGLNAINGSVSTTAAVAPGQYTFQYSLCDLSASPSCATAQVTLNVVVPSIVAAVDSGAATAGKTSKPIANVAANDTINGSPALLGPSGNSTVAKSGTWPAGIVLNAANGAITTAASVPAGSYGLPYKLCDTNSPPVCATATDSVSVVVTAITAVAELGTAAFGIASTPIANVAANDSVNAAAAILGGSGNATVAKVGAWQTGITLATDTGAISTASTVPAGTYTLQYQLCDKLSPPNCVTTADTLTVTPAAAEVQVSNGSFVDIEFDWGRDGIYCPTCNNGQGNARFNWTDKSGNLFVSQIDPATGALNPPTGDAVLVDTTGYYYSMFGNGAEWAVSTQGGNVTSQLVYARHPPGTAATSANAGAALASEGPDGWTTNFLPGTTPGGGLVATVNPLATQCVTDPMPLTYFYGLPTPQNLYWEPLSTAAGTAPAITPFVGTYTDHRSGQKPGIRWIPCTHRIVFIGAAPPDPSGTVYDQVFWYDIDTQVGQQLTFDANNHDEAFMFQAPDFNGSYVLLTLSNNNEIDVYQQTAADTNGVPIIQLANRITSTDPAEPYITGAEPFINCTPQCRTYAFMELRSLQSQQSPAGRQANGVAVTALDPNAPLFKILVPQAATPNIQRIDLEYYITANGPYLYYDRNTLATATTPFVWGNRFYIDMQLGAPTGSCVGSSAEGGMQPGC